MITKKADKSSKITKAKKAHARNEKRFKQADRETRGWHGMKRLSICELIAFVK